MLSTMKSCIAIAPGLAPVIDQTMSLFIPRVFPNITREYIKSIFEEYYNLGQVDRVDLVSKGEYNASYIHFKSWRDDNYDAVIEFQAKARANDPNDIAKVYYDSVMPWYWIVTENTSHKRLGPQRRKEVIQLEQTSVVPRYEPISNTPIANWDDSWFENKYNEQDCNEIDENDYGYDSAGREENFRIFDSLEKKFGNQISKLQDEVFELRRKLDKVISLLPEYEESEENFDYDEGEEEGEYHHEHDGRELNEDECERSMWPS